MCIGLCSRRRRVPHRIGLVVEAADCEKGMGFRVGITSSRVGIPSNRAGTP